MYFNKIEMKSKFLISLKIGAIFRCSIKIDRVNQYGSLNLWNNILE